MKRRRCTTCKHTMKGHKKSKCLKHERLFFENGDVYIGNVYDNKPSGYGTLESTELTYKGEFQDGQRHGFGTETRANGQEYIGGWSKDKYEGKGSLTLEDKSVHEGAFVNGKLHGTGSVKTSTFSYFGQFRQGVYHGQGALQTVSGTYRGNFYWGVQNGQGTYTWSNGDIFTGVWRKGYRCGRGIMSTPEGTYTGNWLHDVKHGHGRLTSSLTGVYDGQWKGDRRHNQGVQTYLDGTTYSGGWSKGKKTGFGIQNWPNGDFYKGFWVKGEYSGRGTFQCNHCTYTGEWTRGQRSAVFTETYENGSSLRGPWMNDVKHGVFVDHNGTKSMYIWGTPRDFEHLYAAKAATKRALFKKEYDAARIICEFFPKVLSWTLLLHHDADGQLLSLVSTKDIHTWVKKHLWTLFRCKRFRFIENLVSLCGSQDMEHMPSHTPELFDTLSHDFVANPWIVNGVSYSGTTKRKLLEGLHLGELGRCPPKDPFTRLPFTEASGVYLDAKHVRVARKIYKTFMNHFGTEPCLRQMAYSFDLEDFQESIQNARAVKDIQTLRRLMKERDDFIRLQRGQVP